MRYGAPTYGSTQALYGPPQVVTGPPTSTTSTVTVKSGNSKVLPIIALVIAIVALVIVLIMSIVYATMGTSNSNSNTWILIQGTNSRNVDDFTPEPNELYIVNNISTPLTVNIKKPSKSIDGRLFMIDNTRNPNAVSVTSSELTFVDNIGSSSIPARTTGVFLGLSSTSFQRLI